MSDDDFIGRAEPSRGGCREALGSGEDQASPGAQEPKSKKAVSLRANHAMDNLLHALGVEGGYFRRRTRPRGGSIP
jgi:hypothetical protein